MDWIYKHFRDEWHVPQPCDEAVAAARAFVAETLNWTAHDAANGFDAAGHMAGHAARACFRFVDGPNGNTAIRIELLVERRGFFGSPGYMLFDPTGYFQRQLRKWLLSISERLNGLPGANQAEVVRNPRQQKLIGWAIITAFLIICLYLAYGFVRLLIGLFTGDLYMTGRYGGAGTTIHGTWARIIAGSVLALIAVLVFLGRRRSARRRRPRILGP